MSSHVAARSVAVWLIVDTDNCLMSDVHAMPIVTVHRSTMFSYLPQLDGITNLGSMFLTVLLGGFV